MLYASCTVYGQPTLQITVAQRLHSDTISLAQSPALETLVKVEPSMTLARKRNVCSGSNGTCSLVQRNVDEIRAPRNWMRVVYVDRLVRARESSVLRSMADTMAMAIL